MAFLVRLAFLSWQSVKGFILSMLNISWVKNFQLWFAGAQSDLGEVQAAQSAEDTAFVFWRRSTRMPVAPSLRHQTYNFSDAFYSSLLSAEELQAAEESFSVYFRPLELYRILQERSSEHPLFLTRSLHYKLQDKHKKRVQLSVSISKPIDDGLQTQPIFPLYILLAKPVHTLSGETHESTCYRFKRACKLTASNGARTVGSPQARFLLCEINKLSTEFKSGSLAILLVSFGNRTDQKDLRRAHMVSPSNESYCLMGKAPIDFIHFTRDNSPKISLGERAEFMSAVDLKSCSMKLSYSEGEQSISFRFPDTPEVLQVPITITAEELWAKDLSPTDLPSYNNIPTDNLPPILRQRTGKVTFKFRYYNNMLRKSEVTEDYTCPFCVLKCASLKGLECHLSASHDLFTYEFWGPVNQRAVNVCAKPIASTFEIVSKVLNPGEKEFSFCHRPMRRRKPIRQNQNQDHVGRLVSDLNMLGVSGPESSSQSVPGSSSEPNHPAKLCQTIAEGDGDKNPENK
ncbi:hypothetical protein QVD17_35772 [Tagetes erecta]|uniref:Polycomb protein VEFS-Box domain-containing protein n=1 Tax=Tagetes erecta TaxID=13708 RepID=A0AAD8NIF6_TARER|nr:hypothetical protein QVD17_35772 [Tagetes erecta]